MNSFVRPTYYPVVSNNTNELKISPKMAPNCCLGA